MWCSTGLTKSMHCIIAVRVGESWVFDSGLTKHMHYIVPSESGEVDLVSDKAKTKYKHCTE